MNATAILWGHSAVLQADIASGLVCLSSRAWLSGRENQSLVSATPFTGGPEGVQLAAAKARKRTKANLYKAASS